MDEMKKEQENNEVKEELKEEEVENSDSTEESFDNSEQEDSEEKLDEQEEDKDATVEVEDEPLKTTLARLQADFQNYRNRTEKEKASVYAYANEKLVLKLLPVIDNLERAIDTEKEHDAFFEGVKMIYDELIKVLDKEGIVRFDPVGEKFDPNFHQAIFMEESDEVESEHILETFQVGYMIKDKVIRPAMVKVSK